MNYMLSGAIGAILSTMLSAVGLCGVIFENKICTVIGVIWIVFEAIKDFLRGRSPFFVFFICLLAHIFLRDCWKSIYIGMISYSFSVAFTWLLTIVLSALTCHTDDEEERAFSISSWTFRMVWLSYVLPIAIIALVIKMGW